MEHLIPNEINATECVWLGMGISEKHKKIEIFHGHILVSPQIFFRKNQGFNSI